MINKKTESIKQQKKLLRNSRQTGFKNIFTTDSGYNIKTFYSLNGNLLLNHLYKDKNVLEERKKKVR